MNTKSVIIIAIMAFAVTFAVVNLMPVQRQKAKSTEAPQQDVRERPAQRAATSPAHLNSTGKEPVHSQESLNLTAAQRAQQPRAGAEVNPQPMPVAPQLGSPKALVQDPLAREALSLVGEDPEATEYWATAINNPNLPDEERKDLIEDLNEDGLVDAKHPGPEDLPLILNRIELIEELAPYAMDQVNADAFAEAYKDLLDMLDGQPVQ